MTVIRTVDPSTGQAIAEYPTFSDSRLGEAVAAARTAQRGWAREPIARRVEPMRELARLLRDERESHARIMAREMGKVVAQGRAESEKCAWACEFYAENAARFLADEPVETDASRSCVAYRPLGLVLAIMPWNFPFWQVVRFAAPALAAGNGVLLKHASNVTGCALALEALFLRAGFPAGLFTTLLVTHEQVAELIAGPDVAAMTMTGSTDAGRIIAAQAGRAVKKIVLELGGSDPFVVLEDADLEAAAAIGAASRLLNAGQSCIAAKRFVVVEDVAQRFVDLLVDAMARVSVGSPLDESVSMGPLARRDLREGLHDQVERSVSAGAVALLGCERPAGPGAFYPPSVLAHVRPGMPAFDEELFGPVAAIVTARDEAEAMELANASPYGLGAAIFTRDAARGERLAADVLEAGACFVNGLVKSDPRLPFGGVKASGHGRELGLAGIREFVNVKTVWVA